MSVIIPVLNAIILILIRLINLFSSSIASSIDFNSQREVSTDVLFENRFSSLFSRMVSSSAYSIFASVRSLGRTMLVFKYYAENTQCAIR